VVRRRTYVAGDVVAILTMQRRKNVLHAAMEKPQRPENIIGIKRIEG